MKEDCYIKYLTIYFNEHGTINNINRDMVVEFEGKPLKIGEFLASIRKQHKLYIDGKTARGCTTPLAQSRYTALDKLFIEWEPGKRKTAELRENDPCLSYILSYYEKNQTLSGLPDIVTENGETLNIKSYISHRRANHKRYCAGINYKGSCGETELRRYAALDSIGFVWEPVEERRAALEADDKPIRFLESYYEQNKTLDGIPSVVSFEGVTLNIQRFLEDRRKYHRRAQENSCVSISATEKRRWAALDAMNYDWDLYETKKKALYENDRYIRYLQKHYLEHGTINDIPSRFETEFEGEILKIGSFINECRAKHWAYSTGKTSSKAVATPLLLKRYQELEAMKIDWRPLAKIQEIANLASANRINRNLLKKYIKKFDGDTAKAIKVCKLIQVRQRIQTRKKQESKHKRATTTSSFEVNEKTLEALNGGSQQETPRKKTYMYSDTMTLRDYCISNGLNYTVISKNIAARSVGLSEAGLRQLITECIEEYRSLGQNSPLSWVYTQYSGQVLACHILTSLQLDAKMILYDMNVNCLTLDGAIQNNCFYRHAPKDAYYLKPIYHRITKFYHNLESSEEYEKKDIPQMLADFAQMMVDFYSLNEKEYAIIKDSVSHYISATKQYQLYDVGFEQIPTRKVDKIIAYKFDDEEIEESFYAPLRFDNKVLLGRDGIIYGRRMLIRDLTKNWHSYDPETIERLTSEHGITTVEREFIENTRQQIDITKAKVKEKRK